MLRLLLILFIAGLFSQAQAADDRSTLSVLADKSMTLPLTEIARQFSAEHHLSVSCRFASPLQNMQQILQGESADVFISAYQSLFKQLKRKGVVDYRSETHIVSAKLALVKNANSTSVDNPSSFVIAAPTLNPEGQYAEKFLESLKPPVNIGYVPSTELLAGEMQKTGAYGITLETRILQLPDLIKVERKNIDVKGSVPFSGIVVAGENMDEARVFLQYLASDDAKTIFRRYGFIIEEKPISQE